MKRSSQTEDNTLLHSPAEEDDSPAMHVGLFLRNAFVVVATILFLISIFIGHSSGVLKFIAYLCGAAAYFCEYLHLTQFFRHKPPHNEVFMVYCFAPLYFLLGLSYLLDH